MLNRSLIILTSLGLVSACFDPANTAQGTNETDATTEPTTGAATMDTTTGGGPTDPMDTSNPTVSTSSATDSTSNATQTTDSAESSTTDLTEPSTSSSSGDSDGGSSTGGLVCDEGESICDDTCTDTAVDAANCGECGHSCLEGSCTDSACDPIELATGLGRLFFIVVSDEDIYVGGDGVSIRRMAKDGTGDTEVAPAGEYAYDYAWTGDAVVWGNDWNPAQWSVRGCAAPSCVGGVQQFVSSASNVYAMAYNNEASRLFWNQGTTVVQYPWPNGPQSNFATGQVAVRSMTSHEDFVYWGDRENAASTDIRARSADSAGGIVDIALGRPEVGSWMAANSSRLFWAEEADIVSAPLPAGIGAGEPDNVGTAGGSVREIVADEDYVYWATSAAKGAGSIARCPVDGCAGGPTLLDAPVDRPWALAQDETALYWVTEAGVVGKIAK